jgi:hypothetical protein
VCTVLFSALALIYPTYSYVSGFNEAVIIKRLNKNIMNTITKVRILLHCTIKVNNLNISLYTRMAIASQLISFLIGEVISSQLIFFLIDGAMSSQLISFLIGGAAATNTDFLPSSILKISIEILDI